MNRSASLVAFCFVSAVLIAGPSAAQSPHTMDHSFSGAEQWAKSFDDPARDAWQMPAHVIETLALKPGQSVADIGAGEEWSAWRGEGALHNGVAITDPPPERRDIHDRLELVAIESADPRWIHQALPGLEKHVHRVRAMGSIAISLCQVATTRVDGMVSLWRCRAVDVAAAQLIVRESGGLCAFPGFGDGPLAAPLDLAPHAVVERLDRLRAPRQVLGALLQELRTVDHGEVAHHRLHRGGLQGRGVCTGAAAL